MDFIIKHTNKEYVVKNYCGVVLGRFKNKTSAEKFIVDLNVKFKSILSQQKQK